MPHREEHDRYCPACNGTRRIVDVSRDDYGYGAKTVTACDVCYVPSQPEPIIHKDDLIAASVARAAAAMGVAVEDYRAAQYAMWGGE